MTMNWTSRRDTVTPGGLQFINPIKKLHNTTQNFILDEVIFQEDPIKNKKFLLKDSRKDKTNADAGPITSVLRHHLSPTFV